MEHTPQGRAQLHFRMHGQLQLCLNFVGFYYCFIRLMQPLPHTVHPTSAASSASRSSSSREAASCPLAARRCRSSSSPWRSMHSAEQR